MYFYNKIKKIKDSKIIYLAINCLLLISCLRGFFDKKEKFVVIIKFIDFI